MANRPKLSILLLLQCFFLTFAQWGRADETPIAEIKKSNGGFSVTLSNNVVASTFMNANKRTSKFYSNFLFNPYYETPGLFNNKYIKLSGELGMNVDWFDSSNQLAASQNRTPKVTDLILRTTMPEVLKFNDVGISVTPGIEVEIPVSTASLNTNRFLALGANVDAIWSKWGLSLIYKPSITGYLHSVPYKSSLCATPTVDNKRPQILPDGRCLMEGQQILALLKNGLVLEYAFGNNTFTGLMRTYHAFLRRPTGEAIHNATNQNYTFNTLGVVEYVYTLPVEFPTYLGVGLSSYQPAISKSGKLKFPFFDFDAPANTELYFSIKISV